MDLPYPHWQPQPRHQGPARLRRRVRRAHARATAEAAANAAVPKKLEAAVEADKTVYTTDAAIQAVVQASNVAVQADASPPQPSDAPAEQEGRQPSPTGQWPTTRTCCPTSRLPTTTICTSRPCSSSSSERWVLSRRLLQAASRAKQKQREGNEGSLREEKFWF